MSKNILIKFVIFLVVVSLVYSVFWFFKAGQLQKQLEAFVSKNSNYVSVGEIQVSGFPLAQKLTIKDLKFTLPGSLLSKRQTIVKHLEAKSGIFSSNFTITLPEPVSVQDGENNLANVEFSKEPEIAMSITDGAISKFTYQDFGYRIVSADKNTIYAASSSSINLEGIAEENGAMKYKVSVNIKDIEGFDVVDVYKNLFEKKIADSLKTGEIVLGSSVSSDANIPSASDAAAVVNSATSADNAPAQAAVATTAATDSTNNQAAPVENAAPIAATTEAAPKDSEKLAEAATDNNLVKSNFMVEFELSSVVAKDEQEAQVPSDPTQIQEVPTQNNKLVKIVNLEFSNNLYKISINGEANILADDALPSGSLSIKIEKIDNLINHLVLHFSKIVDQLNIANAAAAPASSPDVQVAEIKPAENAVDDTYNKFLKKFSANLGVVAKEVAAKNPVSKDDLAEFDIRREKNLDFLVNETSIREIFGKF